MPSLSVALYEVRSVSMKKGIFSQGLKWKAHRFMTLNGHSLKSHIYSFPTTICKGT